MDWQILQLAAFTFGACLVIGFIIYAVLGPQRDTIYLRKKSISNLISYLDECDVRFGGSRVYDMGDLGRYRVWKEEGGWVGKWE